MKLVRGPSPPPISYLALLPGFSKSKSMAGRSLQAQLHKGEEEEEEEESQGLKMKKRADKLCGLC